MRVDVYRSDKQTAPGSFGIRSPNPSWHPFSKKALHQSALLYVTDRTLLDMIMVMQAFMGYFGIVMH